MPLVTVFGQALFLQPFTKGMRARTGGKKNTCGCRPARPMCLWRWGGRGARSGWAGEVAVVAARKRTVFFCLELEMCLAPQQGGIFRRPNFEQWSEAGVLHFDLKTRFAPQPRATFHFPFDQMSPRPPL